MTFRYALSIRRDGVEWFIFKLDRYTSPAWTENASQAKTWASAAAARRVARDYRLSADAEAVAVAR